MKVAIASKNDQLKNRLYKAISKFESFNEDSIELVQYSSYLELLNESRYEEAVIFTDESLVNSQEELHFMKIIKNKNAAANLIHIFTKYVPFTVDEVVVNSVSKFLKNDSNLENSAFKSLSSLFQKEVKASNYGV